MDGTTVNHDILGLKYDLSLMVIILIIILIIAYWQSGPIII